jgi:hypothetical protein
LVHSGRYKAGWLDYSTKCTLAVPYGIAADAQLNTLTAGEHAGVLNKDFTFVLSNKRTVNVLSLLGADGLLTSQR